MTPPAMTQRFPGDRLVLEGYRSWMAAGTTDEGGGGQAGPGLQSLVLHATDRRMVTDGLAGFIHALSHCATCPLAFHDNVNDGSGEPACHDEGLVLALVSALQYGMEDTAFLCATALACPRLAGSLICAAGDCALRLKACGQWLTPVSRDTVTGLIMAKARASIAATTVH
ncbi:hypothetical protein ACLB6G_15635 [Zhengella sp. ZM62]|uniref:hypothetical protein n=1 Tax=Zhengella sedimenti TaxID=3390035 RepID=UPI003975C13F